MNGHKKARSTDHRRVFIVKLGSGRDAARHRKRRYLHLAIDDPSRLAYRKSFPMKEVFPDEKRKSCIRFLIDALSMRCASSAAMASNSIVS